MRLSISILSLFLLARSSVQAQGTVTFYNNADTAITNGLTGTAVAAGTAFKVALYYAPDAASAPSEAELLAVGEAASIGPGDGLFIGKNVETPLSTPPGGAAYFQVRVWETAYGATYAEAVAAPPMNGRPALRGESPIFRMEATGNSYSSDMPPTFPVSLVRGGLKGFTLTHPGLGAGPSLNITRWNLQAILTWTGDPAFQLEFTPEVSVGSWTLATNEVLTTGDERSVVLDVDSSAGFYRLHRP